MNRAVRWLPALRIDKIRDVPTDEVRDRLYDLRRNELADDVAQRVPLPVEPLELTAVIESTGVTDVVASKEYGCRNSFELAEVIYAGVRVRGTATRRAFGIDLIEALRRRGKDDVAGGVLAVAPLVFLLGITQLLSAAGWTETSILAVGAGVTIGMLCLNGPILAMGARASLYRGMEQPGMAWLFLTRWSLLALACCGAFAAAIGLSLVAIDASSPLFGIALAGSLVAFASVWLLMVAHAYSGSPLIPLVALGAGCGVGAAGEIAIGGLRGLAAGYATAVIVLLACWLARAPWGSEGRPQFPRARLLLIEARPSVVYGTVLGLYFLVPSILALAGETGGTSAKSVQLTLLVALPPLLVAATTQPAAIRAFMHATHEEGARLTPRAFRQVVAAVHARQASRNARLLVIVSAATVAVVEVLSATGIVDPIDRVMFIASLVGFALIAQAQLECLTMMNLSLAVRGAGAAVAGMAVLLAVGGASVPVDHRFAVLAFAIGAATFWLVASRRCRAMLQEVDYHYATAF